VVKTKLVRAARLAIVLCWAALLYSPLPAQQKNEDNTTRTVEGMVTDAANQPVSKAVVQLKSTKTLQIRSFITQDDGNYHFAGLGTDVEYQLKADHDGASTSWKTLSVFNSKKTAIINLKLNK
jgi:protocatechuate 3,4-dioxygenase beta subunit